MKNFWLYKHLNKYLLLIFLLLIIFIFLVAYKAGQVSFTFDESLDNYIVRCYLESTDWSICNNIDVSQVRLPYFIHAFFYKIIGNSLDAKLHYYISIFFSLLTLLAVIIFAKKEFNKAISVLLALLIITSIPILTSARMILTHSGAIFTFFTALSFIFGYYTVKEKKIIYIILASVFWGLSVASSLLGVFSLFFFLLFYALNGAGSNQAKNLKSNLALIALFFSLAIYTFFCFTFIYLNFENLRSLIDYSAYPSVNLYFWNYLNLGTNFAPWFFSLVIFAIKITPWWSLFFISFLIIIYWERRNLKNNLQERFLFSLFSFCLVYFFLKSVVFRYDAPHHQLHLYPLVYLIIAYSIYYFYKKVEKKKYYKSAYILLLGALLIVQMRDVYLFFPNYLFYGSQYGKSFVGEFYGPAVIHCQDMDAFNAKLKQLSANYQEILIQDQSCPYQGNVVRFSQRDKNKHYSYAVLDYLHGHLRYPSRKPFEDYVKSNCRKDYSYYFPVNFEVYTLYKCE